MKRSNVPGGLEQGLVWNVYLTEWWKEDRSVDLISKDTHHPRCRTPLRRFGVRILDLVFQDRHVA